MRHLTILLASAALLISCQSNDGPVAPEPTPVPAAEEAVIEKASDLRPIAAVSGKSVQSDMNFSKEMEGAKPGEMRGFTNDDGTKAYVLRTDGKTTAKQFAEYVFNKQEKMNIDPDALRRAALQIAEQNGMAADPDKPMEPNKQVVCQLKFFAKLVKSSKDAMSALKDSPGLTAGDGGVTAGSKKALGYSPPMRGGLDID